MSLEVFQTIVFCFTPFIILLLLADTDEDDDGSDGGMMIPSYAPTS
jgi:hypothetical protein